MVSTVLREKLTQSLGLLNDSSPSGALLHLVHYISRLLSQASSSRSLHYIHQHHHRPLEVAQLAKIEGYSCSYYSEWFKAKTGKSPKAYIQDLRLKQREGISPRRYHTRPEI
ncbi:MAG: AraC family transcriptional regulator [Leptolyngbyaceae cyanobacterium]